MFIQVTDEAAERLRALAQPGGAVFKLVYDAEGCGCAVSGVPALWMLDETSELIRHHSHLTVSELPLILCETRHEVFFEDRMTLDIGATTGSLRLFSGGQIYANDLMVVDKRPEKNRAGGPISLS
jgi:uncharacterized protein YqkB